jgi:hypothetical protein
MGLMTRSAGGITLPLSFAFPDVHGDHFAYPSCFDRGYRGCPQTLQSPPKKIVLKLGYGRVLAHPIHFTVVQSFDAV